MNARRSAPRTEPGFGDICFMVFVSFGAAIAVGGCVAVARGPSWAVVGLGAMTWLLGLFILALALTIGIHRDEETTRK